MQFNHYYDITGREILAGDTIERAEPELRGGAHYMATVFLDENQSFRLSYPDSELTPRLAWLSPRIKWLITNRAGE